MSVLTAVVLTYMMPILIVTGSAVVLAVALYFINRAGPTRDPDPAVRAIVERRKRGGG